MSNLRFYEKEQLSTFSTKRLLRILKAARAIHSGILSHAGPRCCTHCRDFVGSEKEWQDEVLTPAKPYANYIKSLKEILSLREDIPRKPTKHPRLRDLIIGQKIYQVQVPSIKFKQRGAFKTFTVKNVDIKNRIVEGCFGKSSRISKIFSEHLTSFKLEKPKKMKEYC